MPVIDAPSSTQILIVDDNQRMLRALERSIGALEQNIHADFSRHLWREDLVSERYSLTKTGTRKCGLIVICTLIN